MMARLLFAVLLSLLYASEGLSHATSDSERRDVSDTCKALGAFVNQSNQEVILTTTTAKIHFDSSSTYYRVTLNASDTAFQDCSVVKYKNETIVAMVVRTTLNFNDVYGSSNVTFGATISLYAEVSETYILLKQLTFTDVENGYVGEEALEAEVIQANIVPALMTSIQQQYVAVPFNRKKTLENIVLGIISELSLL